MAKGVPIGLNELTLSDLILGHLANSSSDILPPLSLLIPRIQDLPGQYH